MINARKLQPPWYWLPFIAIVLALLLDIGSSLNPGGRYPAHDIRSSMGDIQAKRGKAPIDQRVLAGDNRPENIPTASKSADERHQETPKAPMTIVIQSDDWVRLASGATAVLALFTVASFFVQTHYTRLSFEATTRALTRDRAPFLSVHLPRLVSEQQEPTRIRAGVVCNLKNSGNTAALLRRINVQCIVTPTLRRDIPYATSDLHLPQVPFVISVGNVEGFEQVFTDWQYGEEWSQLQQSGRYTGGAVFMYGFAAYTDVFRNRLYTLGFAWIFDHTKGGLRQATESEAPRCNYETEEEEPSNTTRIPTKGWRAFVDLLSS
jgi:hypothetical protein